MHIFFSVGEPSGDQHAAELMREYESLQPGTRFSGFGGPTMQAEGLDCLFQLTDLAVVGLGQVLPLIRKFFGLVQVARAFMERERPDAVVLVDFPGFNWWIAAAAKRAGIPVYYYCPPQLWAWAPWRIRKVHRSVDCILSVLPFEANWYRKHGVDVEYVGHPFFDEVARHFIPDETIASLRVPDRLTIGILPGSRKQEIHRNFPVMLDVMSALYEKHPHLHFHVACYKEWHFQECQNYVDQHLSPLPILFAQGKTSEIIAAADFCLIVSGSVSLELLARKTPAVVLYRVSWLVSCLGKFLLTVKYFSLPNLIADEPLMPEFPLVRRLGPQVDRMTAQLDEWISHPEILESVRVRIGKLADEIVETGGVKRAACVLHHRLNAGTQNVTVQLSQRAA